MRSSEQRTLQWRGQAQVSSSECRVGRWHGLRILRFVLRCAVAQAHSHGGDVYVNHRDIQESLGARWHRSRDACCESASVRRGHRFALAHFGLRQDGTVNAQSRGDGSAGQCSFGSMRSGSGCACGWVTPKELFWWARRSWRMLSGELGDIGRFLVAHLILEEAFP